MHLEYRSGRAENLVVRAITPEQRREKGFSVVELAVVAMILITVSAIAILAAVTMAQDIRTVSDMRGISAQLSLARMRAASAGTKTRLNFNTTANTYQLEVWSSSASAYQLEGGVQTLADGDTFGFGSITTPAGQQTTIAQTSPIYFNSRGIATDSSGNATASSAIYIQSIKGSYLAAAVSIAGQPTEYRYSGSAWVQF